MTTAGGAFDVIVVECSELVCAWLTCVQLCSEMFGSVRKRSDVFRCAYVLVHARVLMCAHVCSHTPICDQIRACL
eukprot:3303355-Prorocentrum_lima.AAC.1